jgi:hypothetical protein
MGTDDDFTTSGDAPQDLTERDFYGSSTSDRSRSGEADYGVWWWEGHRGGPWRVSYVDATRELYAVELGGDWPRPGEKRLRILGTFRDRDHVEAALEGWAEACGGPGSLGWIEDRCRIARAGSGKETS